VIWTEEIDEWFSEITKWARTFWTSSTHKYKKVWVGLNGRTGSWYWAYGYQGNGKPYICRPTIYSVTPKPGKQLMFPEN